MIVKSRIKANEIDNMQLVGNVRDKTCIIIDDMIDTAGTLCKAAEMLKDNGAKKVYAFATHGVFSGKAYQNIEKSCLEKVIVTNSIPRKDCTSEKIVHLSVGILIAEAIRRIQNNESLSVLFKS
jgi:ribose-phosphate pyrophosphokinase